MRVSTPAPAHHVPFRSGAILLSAIALLLVTPMHSSDAQQMDRLSVGLVARIDPAARHLPPSTVPIQGEASGSGGVAQSMGIGALIGAGVGAVMAVIQLTKTSGDTGYPAGAPRPKSDPLLPFVVMVPTGAALGALVGLIVGIRA